MSQGHQEKTMTNDKSQNPNEFQNPNDKQELTGEDRKAIMIVCGIIFCVISQVTLLLFFNQDKPFLMCVAWAILGCGIATLCYALTERGPNFEDKNGKLKYKNIGELSFEKEKLAKTRHHWHLIGSLFYFPIMLVMIVYFIHLGVHDAISAGTTTVKLFYIICFLLGLVSRTAIQKCGFGG